MSVLAEILAEYEKDKAAFQGKEGRPDLGGRRDEPPPEPGEEIPDSPRMFQKVRDKIQTGEGEPSRDPIIRRLEQIGADFAGRMKDAEASKKDE